MMDQKRRLQRYTLHLLVFQYMTNDCMYALQYMEDFLTSKSEMLKDYYSLEISEVGRLIEDSMNDIELCRLVNC